MGAVHQHAGDQALVGDNELEHAGEGILCLSDGCCHAHIHRGLARAGKGMGKGDGSSGAGGDDARSTDLRDIRGVDVLIVHGEYEAVDSHVAVGVVVKLAGQVDLLVLHHQHGVALGLGDASVDPLAGPHGGGDGDVLVGLGDPQVVVGVVVAVKPEGHGALAAGDGLGADDQAAVDDDLHLHVTGVGGVADLGGDGHALLLLVQDGTHGVAVEGVEDGQVVVLGGVHPIIGDSVVDGLLGEVIGQYHAAGGVGVSPVALVVILVVGRSHMSALVKSTGVVFV